MTIRMENILGMTSTEWFNITGENPQDYIPKGVHYTPANGSAEQGKREFAKIVPPNTRVVVDYKVFPVHSGNSGKKP